MLADPRSFSQLATSFIAYRTQGIPRTPFSYSVPRTRQRYTLSRTPLRPQTSKILLNSRAVGRYGTPPVSDTAVCLVA